jgi:hypothetical protein
VVEDDEDYGYGAESLDITPEVFIRQAGYYGRSRGISLGGGHGCSPRGGYRGAVAAVI